MRCPSEVESAPFAMSKYRGERLPSDRGAFLLELGCEWAQKGIYADATTGVRRVLCKQVSSKRRRRAA